jgi:hypothetical protein
VSSVGCVDRQGSLGLAIAIVSFWWVGDRLEDADGWLVALIGRDWRIGESGGKDRLTTRYNSMC